MHIWPTSVPLSLSFLFDSAFSVNRYNSFDDREIDNDG